MRFEPGKYYRHTDGREIATLDFLETTMWGRVLIAEDAGKFHHSISSVGTDSEDYAVNWEEITKDEWMKNFSKE